MRSSVSGYGSRSSSQNSQAQKGIGSTLVESNSKENSSLYATAAAKGAAEISAPGPAVEQPWQAPRRRPRQSREEQKEVKLQSKRKLRLVIKGVKLSESSLPHVWKAYNLEVIVNIAKIKAPKFEEEAVRNAIIKCLRPSGENRPADYNTPPILVYLADGSEELRTALLKKCHDLSQINQELGTSIQVHEDLTPRQSEEFK